MKFYRITATDYKTEDYIGKSIEDILQQRKQREEKLNYTFLPISKIELIGDTG